MIRASLSLAARTRWPRSRAGARRRRPTASAPRRALKRASVTVAGDVVRIGDLVENAGAAADVPIFRAPDLGQTGTVPVARVRRGAAPHDVDRPRHPRPCAKSW